MVSPSTGAKVDAYGWGNDKLNEMGISIYTNSLWLTVFLLRIPSPVSFNTSFSNHTERC